MIKRVRWENFKGWDHQTSRDAIKTMHLCEERLLRVLMCEFDQQSIFEMKQQVDESCFVSGISSSFQKSYYYYTSFISPFTLFLSIWCCLSNTTVIAALLRIGIKSIRPGLLMLCSLTLTDILWGTTVAGVSSGIRIKHLLKSQICEVYSEMTERRVTVLSKILFFSTALNLCVISIDRYLAVNNYCRYKSLVTRPRAIVACTLAWLIATIIGVMENVRGLSVCCAILAATIIVVVQAKTLHNFSRRVNRIAASRRSHGNPLNAANASIERQLTKTTFYVLGLLVLVFIPAATFFAATVVTKKPFIKLINPIFFPLLTLSSGINPILSYRGNGNIRQAVSKILKCK